MLYAVNGWAQQQPSSVPFKHLTMEEGLPNNTINHIYKDHKGFIWLGTQSGLARFDGQSVNTYAVYEGESILVIGGLDATRLYVGTDRGVSLFDCSTNTKIVLQRWDMGEQVTCLQPLGDSVLYVGSSSGLGVLRLTGSQAQPVLQPCKGLQGEVRAIVLGHNSKLWVLQNHQLVDYHWPTDTWEGYPLPSNVLATAMLEVDSLMYIGTNHAGILVLNKNSGIMQHTEPLKRYDIRCLGWYNGRLLAGTNGGGLVMLDAQGHPEAFMTHVPKQVESISSNAIYSMLIDGTTLWVGTYFGGLNFTPSSSRRFALYNNPPLDFYSHQFNVRSLWIGASQKVLGTREGFIYEDSKRGILRLFSMATHPLLASNIILFIYPLGKSFLIGTYNGGVYLFDPARLSLSLFDRSPFFTQNSFYAVTQDAQGHLWFATLNGVVCYNPSLGTYRHFTTANSALPDNTVFSITCDSHNRIWIGTNTGVCRYHNGYIDLPLQGLHRDSVLSFNMVRYMYEDRLHNMWLCSEKEGVIRLGDTEGDWNHYTEKSFLTDKFVVSVTEDKFGYLWFVTSKCIVRYHHSSKAYAVYNHADGLPVSMFNASVYCTPEGLWWGNEKGLVQLAQLDSVIVPRPSSIEITGLYVGGLKLPTNGGSRGVLAPEYSDTLYLTSKQDNFGIRFADLAQLAADQGVYEYTLSGRDTVWQLLGKSNIIVYNDLKPNTYTLHIRRAGSQEQVRSVVVVRAQSYWWVALVAGIVAVLTLAWLLMHNYVRKLMRVYNIKAIERSLDVKYKTSKLEPDELVEMKEALLHYMDENQPYLKVNLKLDEVAMALSYPKVKVSQCLNQYLQTNFADFVNNYRIQEFKRRATQANLQQYTLSALAQICGFNSRSGFFHAFKKLTGQTPLEYLKEANLQNLAMGETEEQDDKSRHDTGHSTG